MTTKEAMVIMDSRPIGWLAFFVAEVIYGAPTVYCGIKHSWGDPIWFYVWGIGMAILGFYFPIIHRVARKKLGKAHQS